jgi:hypothetical protein
VAKVERKKESLKEKCHKEDGPACAPTVEVKIVNYGGSSER